MKAIVWLGHQWPVVSSRFSFPRRVQSSFQVSGGSAVARLAPVALAARPQRSTAMGVGVTTDDAHLRRPWDRPANPCRSGFPWSTGASGRSRPAAGWGSAGAAVRAALALAPNGGLRRQTPTTSRVRISEQFHDFGDLRSGRRARAMLMYLLAEEPSTFGPRRPRAPRGHRLPWCGAKPFLQQFSRMPKPTPSIHRDIASSGQSDPERGRSVRSTPTHQTHPIEDTHANTGAVILAERLAR
jgi:hypothetical protein